MSERFVSKVVKDMAPSGIRRFFDLVLGAKDVVSLGVGEPDFVTPWKICDRGIDSIQDGYTSYTSNRGLPALRKEIARFLKEYYGMKYDPDTEILVTTGVSQGLDIAMRTILNPGEKVIVVQPSYVAYCADVLLAGGRVVEYMTRAENGFKVDVDELAKLMRREKPKAILLNFPCNPTGATYTRAELAVMVEAARENDVLILSDEIYDLLSYERKHVPLPLLRGAREQTLYFNGFSKGFAMTGWRVGYVCGPRDIISQMTKVFGYVMLSAPIMGQFAACEALHCMHEADTMVREYKRRRNFIVDSFNAMGLHAHMPEGAFYCFPSIVSTGMDGLAFATELLKRERVAVVPGDAFGGAYTDFIRISYASPFDDIKEAVVRMERFISNLKK
jgi:aminotransferase